MREALVQTFGSFGAAGAFAAGLTVVGTAAGAFAAGVTVAGSAAGAFAAGVTVAGSAAAAVFLFLAS